MIIGIGNDIIDLRRLQRALARHPQRLPRHLLSAAELKQREQFTTAKQQTIYLAGRWAAKEALGKACGCGLRAPLNWRQISVLNHANGQPYFELSAAAAAFIQQRKIAHCHLAISHDGDYAAAMVVLESAERSE